ncbi:MAG: hypothetical protein HY778_03305 [Betaproteobacteria bacterium]|nr:hypothetical protein [Betaproteobacteria bacterium]
MGLGQTLLGLAAVRGIRLHGALRRAPVDTGEARLGRDTSGDGGGAKGTLGPLAAALAALLVMGVLLVGTRTPPPGGASPAAADGHLAPPVVEWPRHRLLYVGDRRNGLVTVLQLRPSLGLVGHARAPGRGAVTDMLLDEARGRLWVLGPQTLDEHDAIGLRLLRRLPLPPEMAAGARLQAGGAGVPRVVAASQSTAEHNAR